MNIVNGSCLSKVFVLLLVNGALCVGSANAAGWQESLETKSSFSEFSPPTSASEYRSNIEEKPWASGRTFNEENKVRYSPVTTKNPWKAVKSTYSKKSFSSQRPWGKIPDRKPTNKNNMKLHDQRFKQWSHQQDSFYRNNAYGQSPLPFSGVYGYPGLGRGNPLITPSIYPGSILNNGGYGLYPAGGYPFAGLLSGPRFW